MWDERCDVRGEIHEGSRGEEEGRQEACGISLRVSAALYESSIQMLHYLEDFCQYICARKCLRESGFRMEEQERSLASGGFIP